MWRGMEIIGLIKSVHINGTRHFSLERSIDKLYSCGIKYSGCTVAMKKFIKYCKDCLQAQ